MNDQVLRSKLIRLANENPEMRQHLMPLLKQAALKTASAKGSFHDYEEKWAQGVMDAFLKVVGAKSQPVSRMLNGGMSGNFTAAVSGVTFTLQYSLSEAVIFGVFPRPMMGTFVEIPITVSLTSTPEQLAKMADKLLVQKEPRDYAKVKQLLQS